jgi:RNA polymerase sigma-70 factor (ECF subfamily)
MSRSQPASEFAPTHWSLILRARGADPEARAALGELCAAYWQPVFRFIVSHGHPEDSARELTQEFFARVLHRGANQGSFQGADPSRGRFRSYLLGAVKHFLADQQQAGERLKRGGGVAATSLDHPSATGLTDSGFESSPGWQLADPAQSPADHCFDRQWALTLMARALERVEAEFAGADRSPQFRVLKPWLVGETDRLSTTTAAAQLQLSENAVKVAIHRLRKRFRELIRREVAQTLPESTLVDEEMRYLVEVLSRE